MAMNVQAGFMPLRIFQRYSERRMVGGHAVHHQLRILKSGWLIDRSSVPTVMVAFFGTTSPKSPGMYQRTPRLCRKAATAYSVPW